jgi:hypothetical protein
MRQIARYCEWGRQQAQLLDRLRAAVWRRLVRFGHPLEGIEMPRRATVGLTITQPLLLRADDMIQ